MAKQNNTTELKGFRTGIDTLDQVLDGGVKCTEGRGILGAIFGAAGTGKSTLSLQLCCRFLIDKSKTKNNEDKAYAAIYITHEKPELVENKIETFNDFCSEQDPKNAFNIIKDGLDYLLDKEGDVYRLYIIQIPFEEKQQTAILQNVFDTLAQRIDVMKDEDPERDPYGNILVCIDNVRMIRGRALISAISGRSTKVYSGDKKDTREQTKADRGFYAELQDYCGERGLHTFLVIEEDIPEGIDPESSDISSRPEVYAADFVIRMGIRAYEQGYRERFIQVIKAKNQFYYRGKHHCSIVSTSGGGRPEEEDRGVVIYPSIPMQLSLLEKKERKVKKTKPLVRKMFCLGIKSLDEKINKKIGQDAKGYIAQGTNCVLVSDLDIKATEIALHFAMNEGSHGLYISFMHKEETVREIAWRFWANETVNSRMTIKDFAPEYISEHKLLRDINELIREAKKGDNNKHLFVVIDNVFELNCKYPLIKDARTFLAALLELFNKSNVNSFVVDTVEVGEGRNPIESSVAAGLADNVFLLRHVEFHSSPHRVFSALKLVGVQTPDNLWDLHEEASKDKKHVELKAKDTFALYKNVLTGQPEPVTITLSLYMDAEGSPFHEYLKGQITSLEQMFGESLNTNLYGAQEYPRVHNFITNIERLPRGDCHIVALDEFWLKSLIKKDLLEEITSYVQDKDKQKKYKYVCAAHDIAIYKNKKASESTDLYKKWYAVPARNNCGVLCYNVNLVREVLKRHKNKRIKAWLNNPLDSKKTISWRELLELRKAFSKMGKQCKKTCRYYDVTTFFTFSMDQIESCVCFLLELAQSYAKEQSFLKSKKDELTLSMNLRELPVEALQTFVSLLDEENLKQVASGRFRASKDEPAALFSRRWMSTLGCLRLRKSKIKREDGLGVETVPDCNGYFETLEPYSLPVGLNKKPTPVSGTWYVGILKGSTAVEIGVKLIEQFTSVHNEIYKLNNYIGFPVTEEFYKIQAYRLPYSERFLELAEVQLEFLKKPNSNDEQYRNNMLKGFPIYRILIEDYPNLTPILWRLMIKTAKRALTVSESDRLSGSLKEKYFDSLRNEAADEYGALK